MAKEKVNRPKQGWRQLDFSTFICSPDPKCAAVFFFLLFIFALVLTSVILSHSFDIFEKTEEIVDQFAIFDLDSEDIDKIKGDLFIYLEYEDYYQNHRIYLKSKSKEQLADEDSTSLSTDCEPLYKKSDLEGNLKDKIKEFYDEDKILPCGLMPASYVQTEITASIDGGILEIDESDITWPTDDDRKYQNQKDSYLNITDDHFIVWMRNSPTRRLNKLFGRIKEDDLKKGKLAFKVVEGENRLGYNPDRYVKISTNNRLGGRNNVLGWTFFVVTVLSLVWCIVFGAITKFHKVPTFNEVLQMRKKN